MAPKYYNNTHITAPPGTQTPHSHHHHGPPTPHREQQRGGGDGGDDDGGGHCQLDSIPCVDF